MSGVGDELSVAWMIDGLHTDNDLHQLGIVLADVFDQFGLGIGWPGNENRAGIGNRLSDGLEEGVIFRRVPASHGVCLMMNVAGRMIRVQHQPLDIGRAEMEHACFITAPFVKQR